MQMKSTSLAFDRIIWICGFAETDRYATKKILEDLEPLCAGNGIACSVHFVSSAEEAVDILKRATGQPIVHLEMHGDKTLGLRVDPKGDFISWEQLYSLLQRINVAMMNRLLVVSACCYGLRSIMQIQLAQPAPYKVLLAPEETVTHGEILNGTLPFYRELFLNREINAAHAKGLTQLQYLHCEKLLFEAIVRYRLESCVGKGKASRIERLVSEAREDQQVRHGLPIRTIRRMLKRKIRTSSGPRLLKKYTTSFLMGEPASFTSMDIDRAVDTRIQAKSRGKLL
tara:strand:- start:5081 stop:5932 length:852 start_codon:yes stop_codon:yes gene_type:complete